MKPGRGNYKRLDRNNWAERERKITPTEDERENENSKANDSINIEKDNLELG